MIRLSRLTDYAIVLLSQMAGEASGLHAASDLAERTKLPLPTTSKIMKKLAKSGILTAHRGANGGYALACDPSSISVASIIEAMDGPIAITDCADTHDSGSCTRSEAMCPMRSHWHKINAAIRTALEEVSLASLVPKSNMNLATQLAELIGQA